jgi:hypothetical protein
MKAIASRLAGSKNVVLVVAALLVACSSNNQPPEEQPKPRTVVDAGDQADDTDDDADKGPTRPSPQGDSCDVKAMAMNLTGILQGIASGAASGLPERCTPGSDTCGVGKCCADPTSLTDASGLPIPIPAAPTSAPTAVGLCLPGK